MTRAKYPYFFVVSWTSDWFVTSGPFATKQEAAKRFSDKKAEPDVLECRLWKAITLTERKLITEFKRER